MNFRKLNETEYCDVLQRNHCTKEETEKIIKKMYGVRQNAL
jgi:hypothetical protein